MFSLDAASIKEFLALPMPLLFLMLFGSALNVLKQLKDARANGSKVTVLEYFLTTETAITIGTNFLAFIGLIMTDTLNWTGALAIGYALNSLSDLKPQGRSAMIIDKIPKE
jgi:hypothetical protein